MRRFAEPGLYRRLLYLLAALPLGQAWFIALVTAWSLCVSLVVTPLVIPLAIGLAMLTRGLAAVEAAMAGALLGVEVHAPAAPSREKRFWARFRAQFGAGFWRATAFLLARWAIGLSVSIALLSLLAVAVGFIFAPLWVPYVSDPVDLWIFHPHTVLQSLPLIPLGFALLAATLLLVNPLAAASSALARSLLPVEVAPPGEPRRIPQVPAPTRRGLAIHATAQGLLVGLLVVIWGATSRGYFWPVWVLLPAACAVAIHAWWLVTYERPEIAARFHGSRSLARSAGVCAVVGLFLVIVWAITGQGYFWPFWALLGLALALGAHLAVVVLTAPDPAMTQRIETLESTRAAAVDLQESELRRIERDLHDGAQARLVALGMSLGMAEQKLAEDPAKAGELLAEARAGAEQALKELRDLARGIHPPVLADRGLEAAIAALATASPMDVSVSAEIERRPPSPVESAAYFVVAESLANAAKHAHATHVEIRLARVGDALEVDVRDDGVGGADPDGSGLRGLRRRVEALDGTLRVGSGAAGGTTVHAELPCA